ncbi:hypothetical protein [Gordonia sp. (in: high G+C Gram-positive bacteria)]|uniref:hypothetical protein n=1 Tax=Gordonia sp. (in: high G+C Gram-positive bacteria) TaxID=84139 RepID=UPI003F978318
MTSSAHLATAGLGESGTFPVWAWLCLPIAWPVIAFFVLSWLALVYFGLSSVSESNLPTPERVVWCAAVMLLPFVGYLFWLVYLWLSPRA